MPEVLWPAWLRRILRPRIPGSNRAPGTLWLGRDAFAIDGLSAWPPPISRNQVLRVHCCVYLPRRNGEICAKPVANAKTGSALRLHLLNFRKEASSDDLVLRLLRSARCSA